VRVRVENTNPLCYNVGVDAQAVDAEVNVTDLTNILRNTTPAPPPQPAPAPVAGQDLRITKEQTLALPDVSAALEKVEELLARARASIQVAEAERADAMFIVNAVWTPSCQAGRGFTFGVIVGRWRVLQRASDGDRPLTNAIDHNDIAAVALDEANRLLQTTVGAQGAVATRRNVLVSRHDTLNGYRVQLAAELLALQRAVESAGARLDDLSRHSQAPTDDVTLDHDTERVKVTIRSYPVVGSGAPPINDVVDEIPVRRTFRAFLSTGVLVSHIPQPHYVQVHRQAVDANGAFIQDSTYLTYASTEAGGFATFSPAVQLNVSVLREPVSALFSFGATTRTVNRSLGVEPFVGLSGTLLDRLVGTIGWHWGRQEHLLLGSDEEVLSRPIPKDITREEAVGTKSASGLFLSFSIKP
jgi:hypothetical protein